MAGVGGAGVPSLSEIVNWDTAHLEQAATDWSQTATQWEDHFGTIHRDTLSPGGPVWSGQAADAAQERTYADLIKVRGAADALGDAASAARRGADELHAAKRRATDAIADAEDAGFTVGEDLSVTSRASDGSAFERALRNLKAKQHAADIAARAADLSTADKKIAANITRVTAPLGEVSFADAPASNGHHDSDDPSIQFVDNRVKKSPTDPSPTTEPRTVGDPKPTTWQDLLLAPEPEETPASGPAPSTPKPKPGEAAARTDPNQPHNLDDALSGVAGAKPGKPPSFTDTLAGKLAGDHTGEKPNPGSPIDALAVASDPGIVDRQAAHVDAAQQAVAAAQANADDLASSRYTTNPGSGPNADNLQGAGQSLFDARHNLTEQTKTLEGLSQARAALGGHPVPIPALPDMADVQSFPPRPSAFAEGSRALHDGSLGIIPDVAHDAHVLTHWGESSGADQTGAVLDVAGSVPIPGAKLAGEALQHGLDAANATHHVDGAGHAIGDAVVGAHRDVETPSAPHMDPGDQTPDSHTGGGAEAGSAPMFGVEDSAALLTSSEASGGHLIDRHVDQSFADMSARLEARPSLDAVSTFATKDEAAAAVSAALQRNQSAIETWVANGSAGTLTLTAPFNGGAILMRDATEVIPGSSALVVLKSDGMGSWYVLTGYVNP